MTQGGSVFKGVAGEPAATEGSPPMPHPHDPSWNRDEDQTPGDPPRAATEPKGAKASVRSDKTFTDPASGEPNPAHAPNQARTDLNPGQRKPRRA